MSDRPRTRADCADGYRPCPYVSCRYHLALDVADNGTLTSPLMHGALSVKRTGQTDEYASAWVGAVADGIQFMADTCALDVAERGGLMQEEIADLYGQTRQAAQQCEQSALHKIRSPLKRDGWDRHRPVGAGKGPAEQMIDTAPAEVVVTYKIRRK